MIARGSGVGDSARPVRSLPPPRIAAALPNGLSALRLVIAAIFPVVPDAWRLPLLVIAAVSDLTDGLLARTLGVSSWAGGVLDAVADKVLVLVVLICFTVRGELSVWETILLLQRDTVVLMIAAQLALLGKWAELTRMPPRIWGKLTTAGLLALFILLALPGEPGQAGTVLIYVTAALSTGAGIDYAEQFARGTHRLQKRGEFPGQRESD